MKQHFVFWNDRQMTPERLSAFHCRSGRSGCHSVVPMSFQNVLSEHKRQRNDRRPPGKSGVGYLHVNIDMDALLTTAGLTFWSFYLKILFLELCCAFLQGRRVQ